MSEIKHFLRKQDFPNFAKEALVHLEQLICCVGSSPQQQRLIQEIIEEFIFCEIDRRGIRKKKLNAIQELQLLEVLCVYFENQSNEVARNTMFLHLFHYECSGSNKMKILSKLVSLSIAIRNSAILNCSSVWMQQQGCTSDIVVSLIKDLVTDYFILIPKSSSFLTDLPQICINFASNFLTGTTALYNCPKTEREMPIGLLKLITQWISLNPHLCLTLLTVNLQNSLPRGSITMPSMTPLPGLIRWCVQAPLLDDINTNLIGSDHIESGSQRNQIYSQLHTGVLESMMACDQLRDQLVQKEVMLTRDYVTMMDSLQSLISRCAQRVNPDKLSVSLERLGQAIQMSISTGCLHGNVSDLCLHITNKLPQHRLLTIIINKYKIQ